jgi:chromosome partitioning protein
MVTHFQQSDGSIACKRTVKDLSNNIAQVNCKKCLSITNSHKTVHFRKTDGSIACGRIQTKDPNLTNDLTLITCQRCLSYANGQGSGGRKSLGLDSKLVRVGFYDGDLEWAESRTGSLSETVRNSVRFYRKYTMGEIMIQHSNIDRVIIAVTSSSGGTGKTTTSRNLAAEFSRRGKRVLLIDLDPQANLDLFCGLIDTPHHPDGDVTNIFAEKFDGRWPISLLPEESTEILRSSRKMKEIQGSLAGRRNREKILSRELKKLPEDYQIIIIDCPATPGYLTDNALAAATHVIAPIVVEEKSVQGLGSLLSSFHELAAELEISPPIFLGVVPYIRGKTITATTKSCAEGLMSISEELGFNILPQISDSEYIRKANGQGYSIGKLRPNSEPAKEFVALADRVQELLEQNHGN